MSGLLPRKTLWSALALLLIAGAWLLGRHQGTRHALDMAISQATDNISLRDRERILFLEQEVAKNAGSLDAAASVLEAAEKRSSVLEVALDEALTTSVDDAAELALYRRIESSDEPHSLAVEEISWNESVPASIDLTLIQWRGRERVNGQLEVSLGFVGTQSDSTAAARESEVVETMPPVDFEFRFFQKLTIPVDVPMGSDPDFVEIRVTPSAARPRALAKRVQWPELQ